MLLNIDVNITPSVRTSLYEEAEAIIDIFSPYEHRSEIRFRPEKPDMPVTFLYDISKAKRDFNYQIKYRLLEMFKEMKLKRFPHLINR